MRVGVGRGVTLTPCYLDHVVCNYKLHLQRLPEGTEAPKDEAPSLQARDQWDFMSDTSVDECI